MARNESAEAQEIWIVQQEELKSKVISNDLYEWQFKRLVTKVAGMDLSFIKGNENMACAALIVCELPDFNVIYEDITMVPLNVPYIPGFLGFREAPALVDAFSRLCETKPDLVPECVLVDGNGTLHPRGFGLASHIVIPIADHISCSHDMMSGVFCKGATHLRFQCALSFLVMFSNQRKCLTEDEVLDILYNDDSSDDLTPELDSNSDSESDNEAYRTDIIHVMPLKTSYRSPGQFQACNQVPKPLTQLLNKSTFLSLVVTPLLTGCAIKLPRPVPNHSVSLLLVVGHPTKCQPVGVKSILINKKNMSNPYPGKPNKKEDNEKSSQSNETSIADELFSCLENLKSRKENKTEEERSNPRGNEFPKNRRRLKHLPEQSICTENVYNYLPDIGKGNEKEKGQLSSDGKNKKHNEKRTDFKQFGNKGGAISKVDKNAAFPPFNVGETKQKNVGFDLQQSSNEGWHRVKTQKRKTDKFEHSSREVQHDRAIQSKNHNIQLNINVNVHEKQMQENGSFAKNFEQSTGEHNSNMVPQATSEFRTRQHVLGYKEIESLSEKQDPYDVLKGLADRVTAFERTLKQPLRPDLLILILKLLSKLSKLDFDDLKIQLLSRACDSSFLDQLSKHIVTIPLERNIKRKAQAENFLEDVLTFLETVLNLCPTKAADNFGDIFTMTDTMLTINAIQKRITVSEAMVNKFKQLNTQFTTCVEEQEKKKKMGNDETLQTYELAPNDFRDMSLFPIPEDVLSDDSGFLRPNIVEGAYENVNHYLDVQFRLLREDFVSPLREGISQYVNIGDKKNLRKITHMKIYQKVFFLNPKVVKDKLCLIVCFDPDKRFKNINWEHTKRFMFGSLLVFSKDNFSNIIFGTVMDRNLDDLKKGRILVGVCDPSSMTNDLFMNEYVMAESSVYFEPYYHVMKALQGMEELTFPMERYIVHADVSDNPPKYLMQDGGLSFEIDRREVSVLDENSWPSAEYLKLDESQYQAFKASLTREFVIVQGPPGTDQHLQCFQAFDSQLSEKYFSDWLEYGMYEDAPPEEIQEENIQNDNPNIENLLENGVDPGLVAEDEDDIHNQWDDMLDLELDIREVIPRIKFVVDLRRIKDEIEWEELQLLYLEQQVREDPKLLHKRQECEMICNDLRLKYNYLKNRLAKEDVVPARTIHNLLQQGNLWELQPDERWILYRFWVERLRTALLVELQRLNTTLHVETRMYEDAQQIYDLEIMRSSLVVGMTTTGAARLQRLLKALKPKIVIVEEAAEVFESHIVVSLTHHCEHLILIGDHKQLRPSPAVFKLAKDYNFDISLFERMLKNNMHCAVLKVQHRMRPEIAELIVPTIYPELLNHNTVLQYEKIRGMLKSLYFITHNNPEEQVEDISSHKNTHEGDFLIELCRYLVLQGYEPSRITILATYSGQMFYLRSVRKQHRMLSEVKITVVDNFQGEENDIILLSLVRSNNAGKIGFLKIENRVCVALSRARKGMYIIGNMDILTRNSQIWPKIRETLMKQEAIGTHLTLRCQIHPSEFTRVCSASDFNHSPEGGCKQLCGADLLCGHKCKSVCHVQNREHVNYHCFEQCERIPDKCEFLHQCTRKCWENCGDCLTLVERTLPCGHKKLLRCGVDFQTYKCQETVEVQLPDCGHKVKKPCHRSVNTFPCPMPCEYRPQCGHICSLNCHTRDDPDHLEIEGVVKEKERQKRLRHKQVDSLQNASILKMDYKCNKPCAKNNAGCKENHLCKKLCHEDCGECNVKVERDLPHCDHKGWMQCSQDPETYVCMKKCQKILPCGHKCPNNCSSMCGNCPVKVQKMIPSCGHSIQVKCCEDPDSKNCHFPCKKILRCGHRCTTLCSAPCIEKCQELVISRVRPVCGHSVYIPCFMQNQIAMFHVQRVAHRVHESVCIDVNILNVQESADNHVSSAREPCTEPCDLLLKCNHPCIGFCGETCPPLCRVCNKDEVTEIFFGNEDEPDARFVLLEDCKHVFESTALEHWMSQSDDEIKLKCCPRCNTQITKTQRYMNIVKEVYRDICNVKRHSKQCQGLYDKLLMGLRPVLRQRSNILSSVDVGALRIQIEIFSQLTNYYYKDREKFDHLSNLEVIAYMDILLGVLKSQTNKMGKQEVNDFNMEIQRFFRICQLYKLKSEAGYKTNSQKPEVKNSFEAAYKIVKSIEKWSNNKDAAMEDALEKFCKEIKGALKITDSERKMIVEVMGFKQGHWYKCPNGHPYCIDACGGAMQVSKCNECGAAIGGSSHRLLSSNAVATEMDGATRPAWP
ncbi:hypothetical protein C0J52_22378 [Blattella germanica]|nr:hypothetical protein C0J52_22378 [Blattella germanica]